MCRHVKAIIVKELKELIFSGKKLFIFLLPMIFPVYFAIRKGGGITIPLDLAVFMIPIIVSSSITGQIISDSILSEKKMNTLEILLSSGIKNISIIIGKVLPACLIGYIFFLISYESIKVILAINNIYTSSISFLYIGFYFLILYFCACLVMCTTIIIPDEKVTQTFGGIVLFAANFSLYFVIKRIVSRNIEGYKVILIFLIMFLLCIFMSIITSKLLSKIVIITKV